MLFAPASFPFKVELLFLEAQQREAYAAAVEHYRCLVEGKQKEQGHEAKQLQEGRDDTQAARVSPSLAQLLPKKQVTSIFVHLRKVSRLLLRQAA